MKIDIGGIDPLGHFAFQCDDSQAVHTLFTQLMLEHGFLASKAFYATYAHQDGHIEAYLAAVEHAFFVIRKALERNAVLDALTGPVAHAGFQRLT
jgi:glutamate-1-semialdehyde 2,1-aminomutase